MSDKVLIRLKGEWHREPYPRSYTMGRTLFGRDNYGYGIPKKVSNDVALKLLSTGSFEVVASKNTSKDDRSKGAGPIVTEQVEYRDDAKEPEVVDDEDLVLESSAKSKVYRNTDLQKMSRDKVVSIAVDEFGWDDFPDDVTKKKACDYIFSMQDKAR